MSQGSILSTFRIGWATVEVPSCLVPGAGVICGRGNTGVACESLIKEMARVWTLDWSVCVSKGCLQRSISYLGIS